jgi:hypothetical protein
MHLYCRDRRGRGRQIPSVPRSLARSIRANSCAQDVHIAERRSLIELSTAPQQDEGTRVFEVTHQFHPLFGRRFDLIAHRNHWGQDRVFFLNQENHIASLPAAWTDVAPFDAFLIVSAGRSYFRVEDLLELSRLICESCNGKT